jgi:hypothetical protein
MIRFRFLFLLSLSLSGLFYIKIEKEERFNPWDFIFLILIFGSLDRDERMVRLKSLAIRKSKKGGLLLVDSFVSEKIWVLLFNNGY